MAKKTNKFDKNNYEDVHSSLLRWTRALRNETKQVSRLRELLTKAQAQRQKALWYVHRRKKQLAKLKSSSTPVKQTLAEALRHVGETENPAGSNKGPGIVSLCQKELIGYDGVAWCGCFGAYFLKHFGGVKVTSRMAYCPFNVSDAENGVNGWAGVRDKYKGQPGDCAMMDWPPHDGTADHFVMILENLGGGTYKTIEGNTSFDNGGSQSNGGCVAVRTRYVSDIRAICIPAYGQA